MRLFLPKDKFYNNVDSSSGKFSTKNSEITWERLTFCLLTFHTLLCFRWTAVDLGQEVLLSGYEMQEICLCLTPKKLNAHQSKAFFFFRLLLVPGDLLKKWSFEELQAFCHDISTLTAVCSGNNEYPVIFLMKIDHKKYIFGPNERKFSISTFEGH